jgi:hypothetical protein
MDEWQERRKQYETAFDEFEQSRSFEIESLIFTNVNAN